MIHRTGTKPKGFRLYSFTYIATNTHTTENRWDHPKIVSGCPSPRFSALSGFTCQPCGFTEPKSRWLYPGSIEKRGFC